MNLIPKTLLALFFILAGGVPIFADGVEPTKILRILPLGDSLTRGSYLKRYADGKPMGSPNPDGGGYRKPLQDQLRAAGIAVDFVGELNYDAYGHNGHVDPAFDPDHQGMAEFSNVKIIEGGVVPTPQDVLTSLGTNKIVAHGVIEVIGKFQPDIILLVSGPNGFDAPARNKLIALIGEHSAAHLFVGTIPPQKPPRAGFENVAAYNQSLVSFAKARQKAGQPITLVDLNSAVSADEVLFDGAHPNAVGLQKIAAAWFQAIKASYDRSVINH